MKAFDYVSVGVVLIPVIIGITLLIGWVKSVIGLLDCDFVSPYRCEVIRGISVFAPPVGGVAGYIGIDGK